MTKYLVLIYGNEQTWADAPDEWQQENVRRHQQFNAEAGAAIITGGELAPSNTATSVRRGPTGHPTTTDGPYLETKEAIGGFYLIEAADDAEAVRLASLVPEASADSSGVEIRRVGG